jgi:quercetin 2,3-dioxygenase
MKVELYPAQKRQHVKHGDRFDSWQSFSFGNWYDETRTHFGALRVFNDDTIGPESEIGMHPHQNYEILSVMLDGKMSHRDSLNNYQEIETDAIQLISCGTGIQHAGKNLSPNAFTKFFQIWIEPHVLNTVPSLQLWQFDPQNALEKWDLRVSPDGEENSIYIKQNCYCSRGTFSRNTAYQLNDPLNGVWLFVLDGSIELGNIVANKRDSLMISDATTIDIKVKSRADLWLMEVSMTSSES